MRPNPKAAGAQARAGKMQGADPARPFTHFRVGEDGVLAIYAELWVGSFGGVAHIRRPVLNRPLQ